MSDAIVPLTSQSANNLSSMLLPGTVHSKGTTTLGFTGPGELDNALTAPIAIQLLNLGIKDSSFHSFPTDVHVPHQ
jgi:hypothetical protein